jgi:hypothetical protein
VAMPSEEGMTSSDSQGMAYRPDRVSAGVSVITLHDDNYVLGRRTYVFQMET